MIARTHMFKVRQSAWVVLATLAVAVCLPAQAQFTFPPQFHPNPLAPAAIDEDTTTGFIPFSISDLDGVATNVTVSATASNDPGLLPLSRIDVTRVSGTNWTFRARPLPHRHGTAHVTLTAVDASSTTRINEFDVEVRSVNDIPTLNGTFDMTFPDNAPATPYTTVVTADNDHNTKGNPGLKAANEAALAVDGMVVWPRFPAGASGSDFNDKHLMGNEL